MPGWDSWRNSRKQFTSAATGRSFNSGKSLIPASLGIDRKSMRRSPRWGSGLWSCRFPGAYAPGYSLSSLWDWETEYTGSRNRIRKRRVPPNGGFTNPCSPDPCPSTRGTLVFRPYTPRLCAQRLARVRATTGKLTPKLRTKSLTTLVSGPNTRGRVVSCFVRGRLVFLAGQSLFPPTQGGVSTGHKGAARSETWVIRTGACKASSLGNRVLRVSDRDFLRILGPSPKGTTVNSQGRKPLDRAGLHTRTPTG